MAGDGGGDLLARHPFVDVGVVGDGLERDVRHRLVLEPAAHAFLRVRQFVVVEDGGHQPLLGERQRHPRGVAGDPAPAPLRRRRRPVVPLPQVRVEDKVAWVGGHEEATLDNLRMRLNNVDVLCGEGTLHGIIP